MVPYKMEQKISCMAEFADSSTEFLLVFLGDGIVKQIKFEDTDGWTRFPYTAEEVMKVKKVAKFPGPTKMVGHFLILFIFFRPNAKNLKDNTTS